MAYALSAAMAVTVVPTYMMKPLVAEAATTETSKEFTEESNGSVAETTLTINSGIEAAVPTIEFYVTTEESYTKNDADKVTGTVSGPTASVTGGVTALENKADTNDTTYYIYANYKKDTADTDNLVKIGTITVNESGDKTVAAEENSGFDKDNGQYTVEAPSPSINFYVSTNASATDEAVSTLQVLLLLLEQLLVLQLLFL